MVKYVNLNFVTEYLLSFHEMGRGIITHMKCNKLNSILVIILVSPSFFTHLNEMMDWSGKKGKRWSLLINT